MEQTLEQRCKVALECLPDARYRTMLASLFGDLLASAAVPADPPRVTVLLPDGDRRDVDVALVDWTATGELRVWITVGEQPQEPVAWMQIGVGPMHEGERIPRLTKPKEWNPEWWRFEPLYATPLARQEPKPDAVYPVQPSSEAATALDAARYRWLTEDHADPATREKCRELLYRMPVMSYAAASNAIDIAMQEGAEE